MIFKLKKLGLLVRQNKMLFCMKWSYQALLPIYNYNGIGYAKEAYHDINLGMWIPDQNHNKLKRQMHLWL
jgi:hypothetical protein